MVACKKLNIFGQHLSIWLLPAKTPADWDPRTRELRPLIGNTPSTWSWTVHFLLFPRTEAAVWTQFLGHYNWLASQGVAIENPRLLVDLVRCICPCTGSLRWACLFCPLLRYNLQRTRSSGASSSLTFSFPPPPPTSALYRNFLLLVHCIVFAWSCF